MAYVTDFHDYYHESHSQLRRVKENQYDDAGGKLRQLCELERIHRRNLAYLESLAAKLGMDTPLRVVNELREERTELARAREGMIELESAIEDSSKWITERELVAAKEQLESKRLQVETHEGNIAYLEDLAATYGEAVPLSLHNAIREEAEQLILTRQCIAKLDHFMQELVRWLDQTPGSDELDQWSEPDFSLQLVQELPNETQGDRYVVSFHPQPSPRPMEAPPTRRWEQQHLIDGMYRGEEVHRYGPRILKTIGQCAFGKNVFLCAATRGLTTHIVSRSTLRKHDSDPDAVGPEPVSYFDMAVPTSQGLVNETSAIPRDDLEGPFRRHIAQRTGEWPELLEVPKDEGSFFEQFGTIVMTDEMQYYSPYPVSWPESDVFDPRTDLVYIHTYRVAVSGNRSTPTEHDSPSPSATRFLRAPVRFLRSWLQQRSEPKKRNRERGEKRKRHNESSD